MMDNRTDHLTFFTPGQEPETNMKHTFYLILLLCIVAAASAQSNRKPNVLLIYTDDQGTLDMHIYGAADLHTPNSNRCFIWHQLLLSLLLLKFAKNPCCAAGSRTTAKR